MSFRAIAALGLAAALFLAACGSDDDSDAQPDSPDEAADTEDTDADAGESGDDGETVTGESTTTIPDLSDEEPAPIPATAPLVSIGVADGDVTLTWDDAPDGIEWEVLRDAGSLDIVDEPSYVDEDLEDGAYHYEVVSIGTEGDRVGSGTIIVQVGPLDLDPPPAPILVSIEPTDERVVITWDEPDDTEDVRGYLIHRDRVFIGYVDDDTEFIDEDIVPGRSYNYRVRSQDDAGNVSEPEAGRIPGEQDLTPPTTPGDVTIEQVGEDVVITWGESTDDEGIWGYLVHRDGEFVVWTALDTEYRESINPDDPPAYWEIRAQDFTGNYSEPTARLSLEGDDAEGDEAASDG